MCQLHSVDEFGALQPLLPCVEIKTTAGPRNRQSEGFFRPQLTFNRSPLNKTTFKMKVGTVVSSLPTIVFFRGGVLVFFSSRSNFFFGLRAVNNFRGPVSENPYEALGGFNPWIISPVFGVKIKHI